MHSSPRLLALALVTCCATPLDPARLAWEPVDVPVLGDASLRGLSTPAPSVVWISGTGGAVALSLDGGGTWRDAGIDAELDLRSLVALDGARAWVASAGSGDASRILRTHDGGRSWEEVHVNREADGFFDAIASWDGESGLVMGDPTDGYLTVLRTLDGGATWGRVPRERMPAPVEGEYAFAASNRSIALGSDGRAWIGTGGAVARVLASTDAGASWSAASAPLRHGSDGAGIFALAFRDAKNGVAVGGDYTEPEATEGNAAFTHDGGIHWQAADVPPRGYRSAVAPLAAKGGWIAVGITGTDVSLDGGRTWRAVADEELNAVSVSGSTAWAVGPHGVVRRMRL